MSAFGCGWVKPSTPPTIYERVMKTIDFSKRGERCRNELKRLLDRDELNELTERIGRLLNDRRTTLNECWDCLADYGLEPDYMDAYLY